MTAAKKKSPAASAAAGVGVPVGRWAQVLAKAQDTPGLLIEPFEVYDGLTLYPMTPARSKKYSDAQLAYFSALAARANAAKFGATQDEVDAIIKQTNAALDAFNEALFGEREYPLVEEYFANQGAELKNLFVEEVRKQFLREMDTGQCAVCSRDGTCPHCGKNDLDGSEGEETPGEGSGESPTSESTTGLSSTETSPTTSM